jgi:hypothetical protein
MCLHQFGMGGASGVFNVGVLVLGLWPSSHSPCASISISPGDSRIISGVVRFIKKLQFIQIPQIFLPFSSIT